MVLVLRRQRAAVQLRRKAGPNDIRPGSAPSRSRKGASSRPSHFRSCQGRPGAAQGSDMLGVIRLPLANEVSSPTPGWRSISVTRQPACARYQADVVPMMPPPRTSTCGVELVIRPAFPRA